jgi:hypothetical protein
MEGGYQTRSVSAECDDAEAVVLLIQNAVEQARRACRQRDWRGLRLEDLRQSTEKERTLRKKALLSDFPILRLGQSWINADGWRPVLTLSGTVRKTDFHPEHLRALPSALGLTDIRILVVVWQREGSGDVSISLYNSHLHPSVTARHLAVRGATANTDPMWTQGGKGWQPHMFFNWLCGKILRASPPVKSQSRSGPRHTCYVGCRSTGRWSSGVAQSPVPLIV